MADVSSRGTVKCRGQAATAGDIMLYKNSSLSVLHPRCSALWEAARCLHYSCQHSSAPCTDDIRMIANKNAFKSCTTPSTAPASHTTHLRQAAPVSLRRRPPCPKQRLHTPRQRRRRVQPRILGRVWYQRSQPRQQSSQHGRLHGLAGAPAGAGRALDVHAVLGDVEVKGGQVAGDEGQQGTQRAPELHGKEQKQQGAGKMKQG